MRLKAFFLNSKITKKQTKAPTPSARLLGNPQNFKGMKSTPVRTPATTTHDEPSGALPLCDMLDNQHTPVTVYDNKLPR